jgi:hypothetical protein
MGKALKFDDDGLAKLADPQRREALKKCLGVAPAPLLGEVRGLILRKCDFASVNQGRETD